MHRNPKGKGEASHHQLGQSKGACMKSNQFCFVLFFFFWYYNWSQICYENNDLHMVAMCVIIQALRVPVFSIGK